MVSVKNPFFAFVVLSPSVKTWERSGSIFKNYQFVNGTNNQLFRGKIEPLNLKWPTFKASEWFQSESTKKNFEEIQENLINEIIDKSSLDDETESKIEKLGEEEKEELFKGIFSKLNEQRKLLSVNNIMLAKNTADSFKFTEKKTLELVDQVFQNEGENTSIENHLLLKDILKKEKDSEKKMRGMTRFKWDKEKELQLKEIKKNVLINEMERLLDEDMNEYSKINPYIWKQDQLEEEIEKLKEKFIEIYKKPIDEIHFKKSDVTSMVQSLSKIFWKIEYYKNQAKVKMPDKIIEILKMDPEVVDNTYKELIESKITKIKDVDIPMIINKKKDVHRLLVFREMLYEELAQAKRSFNKWSKSSEEKINQIKKLGFEVSKYERIPKPIKEVGGYRPYVNINPVCPENPSLVPKNWELEESDVDEGPEREDEEEVKKSLEVVEKDLKIFSHMTQEEMSDFFLGKVDAEVRFARRAKTRRDLIRKLGNPFNTTENIPKREIKEKEKELDKTKEIKIREGMNEEEVMEILSKIQHEYNQHLINIKHLEWQVESAELLPVETLEEIYESGQSILKPEPKKLSFKTKLTFDEAFKDLFKFVKNKDSEAMKYRKKLYEMSGNQYEKEKNDKDEMPLFPNDPVYKRKDLKLMKRMMEDGATFKIQETFPFIEMTSNPTEQQKQSTFYKMTVSQPTPIYRCTKCDYRIFSDPQTAYDGRKITPAEYLIFKSGDYKCWNCGSDKEEFEVTWTTGERGYEPPKYLQDVDDLNVE